jgi:hypothetical protein
MDSTLRPVPAWFIDLDQCAIARICIAFENHRFGGDIREEVIMTMQSDRNGRGGFANNLTLQLTLLAAAVVVVLFLAAHYIW